MVDLGLWLGKEKILIVSDFHLGYEEGLREKGILVPRWQLKDILKRLGEILKKVKPKKIIINGDLKHEFGKILNQEWGDVLKLLDFLLKNCEEVVLVRGNHDLFLGPIASKRGIKVVKEYKAGKVFIGHGDKLKTDIVEKIIIIGHEHPAIDLKKDGKVERYKCFLKGKWKGKEIIVMPSFNPISDGSNVLKGKRFSPYLKEIDKFKVCVVGEKEVFDFGKVKDLTS